MRQSMRDCLHGQLGWSVARADKCAERELERRIARSLLRKLQQERGWQVAGKRILDIGAGYGGLTIELLLNGADAFGIEPDLEFHAIARARLAREGLQQDRLLQATGELLPFPDDSFDFAVSLQVLEHVPNADRVIAELYRVLRPGGRCFISCENYLAFREQEYRVPWIPLMPKGIASMYLRLIGRDPSFLKKHIHYVTYPQVRRACRRAGFVNETYAPADAEKALRQGFARELTRGLKHAVATFRTGVKLHLRKPGNV